MLDKDARFERECQQTKAKFPIGSIIEYITKSRPYPQGIVTGYKETLQSNNKLTLEVVGIWNDSKRPFQFTPRSPKFRLFLK